MYGNVPQGFLPREIPEPVYANPRLYYCHNTATVNAAYEILDRGIKDNGWRERPAIVVPSANGEDEVFSYAELQKAVHRFAGALVGLGVEPGDRVFWRLGEVPAALITQLATWTIGAVNVPSSLAEGKREIEFFLKDTEATVVVTEDRGLSEVEDSIDEAPSVEEVVVAGDADGHPSFNDLLAESDPYDDHAETRASDLASIFYTGGTTGRPKGCMHSHAAEVAIADLEGSEGRAITSDDTMFSIQPLGHAAGNGDKINIPLRAGARIVLADRPSPNQTLQYVERYGVTAFTTVGTVLRQVLKQTDVGDYDLSSIRFHLNMIMDTELLDRWHEETGIEAANGYGMSPMRHMFISSYRDGEKIAPGVSVGQPYAGYEAKVVDIENPEEEVENGGIGRLAIRGPTFTTYWNNVHPDMPERMESDTIDGWALHDDVVQRDEKGYFFLRGRLDDMINSSGFTISPTEVEEVVSGHPAVNAVAVVGAPDELREERVKAFVVLEPGYDASETLTDEIQSFAKENMAKYKYPREIEYLEELPKDDVGKVQYTELRDRS